MAEQQFWRRIMAAIEREYERRIRAASLVSKYGQHNLEHHDEAAEVEAALISNVPRGTRITRSAAEPDRQS